MAANTPAAAPLRGNVGCVDPEAAALRTLPVNRNQDAFNIYGPNEAGFTSDGKSIGTRAAVVLAAKEHKACFKNRDWLADFCFYVLSRTRTRL